MNKKTAREYWEQNIASWGKMYLSISHFDERLNSPRWLEFLYHHVITPIETKLMAQRYLITMEFINRHIKKDIVVVDIGCGTGIFTIEMLKRGARVKAIDFSQKALDMTRTAVTHLTPDLLSHVEFILSDVENEAIPQSDVAIAMGVTPYISNLSNFYDNILPRTKMLYCLLLDTKHWANVIRANIKILNVRNLHFYDRTYVNTILEKHSWELINRQNFASGYIDTAICHK